MSEIASNANIAAIILAAGTAQRMQHERHKLLLPLGGRPVLAHVLSAVLPSKISALVVVLGYNASIIQKEISAYISSPAITYVENPDYRDGISSSLHIGIRALMQMEQAAPDRREGYQGALILLGDQPLVSTSLIDRLIAARSRGKRIVVPFYKGRRGNPVLFDRSLWPELLTTTGDEGGKSIIEKYHMEVMGVEMNDERMSEDIDTWEEYQNMIEVWNKSII